MSSNLDLLHKHLDGAPIRTMGEAIGKTVAVTDDAVVTAKAGLFGRWGTKVTRYPLQALTEVTAIPNPTANVLTLAFDSDPPMRVMLMFGAAARKSFEDIVGLLQARLRHRQNGGQP